MVHENIYCMRMSMKKIAMVVLAFLCPFLLLAQDAKKVDAPKEQSKIITNIPAEAQYSNNFNIKSIFFKTFSKNFDTV